VPAPRVHHVGPRVGTGHVVEAVATPLLVDARILVVEITLIVRKESLVEGESAARVEIDHVVDVIERVAIAAS
jgi:hypothetical protein